MSTRPTSSTNLSIWFKIVDVLLSFGALVIFGFVTLVAVIMLNQALPATSDKAYWFISRSSGVLAYILLTGGVMWGLVQSGRVLQLTIPPALALGLHSFLNWGALAMSALHGLILLGDNYIKMSLVDIVIPFVGPYRPFFVGLGVMGFYLMLLLSSSFYARKWLGQKTFRALHYGSYPTFVFVTWHGLATGTDSGLMWLLFILSLAAVSSLTLWRIAGTTPGAVTTR
jgi:methionine sulfoxide reductase heme-binding subunit